jgi:hypothetical protein
VCEVLDPPVSAFSLSLYRHPFLYTLFSSRFTLKYNKQLEFSPDYPIPKIIQHKKEFLFRGRTQTKENGTCACCKNRTATPRLRRIPTLLCVLVYSCSVGDRTLASFISTVSNEDLRRGKHSVEILLWTNTRNTTCIYIYIYNTLLCIDKRSGSGKALVRLC